MGPRAERRIATGCPCRLARCAATCAARTRRSAPAPHRLWRLALRAAVPLALQGLYVIALRVAAGLGEGNQTSLSYAYLFAATLVSATASSLSLISSAPLTRRGVDTESAAEHVVHSAWISLAFVGAAAGRRSLSSAGASSPVLGDAFSGDVGDELGRLVVFLSPWMVANAAFLMTYPLLFVMDRTRLLIPLALAGVSSTSRSRSCAARSGASRV